MSICNSVQRRELILSALHKLEDRDTMKTAIEELNKQIQVYYMSIPTRLDSAFRPWTPMDCQPLSPRFAESIGTRRTSREEYVVRPSVFIEDSQESVRLFGALAAVDCPSREAFLTSHLLSKSTKFLVHVFSVNHGCKRTLFSIVV